MEYYESYTVNEPSSAEDMESIISIDIKATTKLVQVIITASSHLFLV